MSAVSTLGTAALAGEKTLTLNALGLRKQAVFKVYVGGLYLESPSKGACAILGWLRSRSPLWGSAAAPAGDAIGALSFGRFIAAVAVGAGGSFVQVMRDPGLKPVLAGAIVTTFCTFATFLFDHFVLRMNVAENAGATCSAMTGVAIDEVVKDAKSGVPAIDYALPGAVNNLTFTLVALLRMAIL